MRKQSFIILLLSLALISCKSNEPNCVGMENGYTYVDLGLSVNWATINVGSINMNYGGEMFSWAEVDTIVNNEYKYGTIDGSGMLVSLTKYNTIYDLGPIDNRLVLDQEDDAASYYWGGRWRTPTQEEWEELQTECVWIPKEINNRSGYAVIGKNGNAIYLYMSRYWTSSLAKRLPSYAYSFLVTEQQKSIEVYERQRALHIRPVFSAN